MRDDGGRYASGGGARARVPCSHCGLPAGAGGNGPAFCCAGCRLAAAIVGGEGRGPRAWTLLRLAAGALPAMNVMMISMIIYAGGADERSLPSFRLIMLGLSVPAMLLLWPPFARGAVREVSQGRPAFDTLIASGSLAAFAVSAVNAVGGAGHVYFDTATMLPVLVTFGRLLEAGAKAGAGRLIRGLESILPARALKAGPEGLDEVPADTLVPGDLVRVRPGERVPADGRIVEGSVVVDEAAFTGDSRPRPCGPGDGILAGTVNGTCGLLVRVERAGESSLLRRVAAMAEEAALSAGPSERLSERMAAVLVPAVFVLAAGTAAYWTLAGDPVRGGLSALAVAVVACPCAMGIAAPLATATAIGLAARAGALVRGGDVLERLGLVDTFFLDKTGTATAGRPAVESVETLDPSTSEDDLVGWLAGLEAGSEHALARAVTAEAAMRGVAAGTVREFSAASGRGIRGIVTRNGMTREVTAGSADFIGLAGAPHPGGAATEIFVAWDGRPRGRLRLSDGIRPEAAPAVRRLRDEGVTVILLSGDGAEAAREAGRRIGVDRVEAPRRPDEKMASVRACAAGRRVVAMAGDGINDAPALASVQVGIAMGAGTDLARQAGHVVLLADNLLLIPWLMGLSRRTRRIIGQNLTWAVAYNAAALAAAAAGMLHPVLAAGAMAVSSLTVLANSLRLRRHAFTPLPVPDALPEPGTR